MFERHGTKIATFGGYLDRPMEFKGTSFAATWWGSLTLMSVFAGTAGNQVLDWPDLDSDIKTAGLKNVSNGVHFFKQRSMTVHIGSSCPSRLVRCVLHTGWARLTVVLDWLTETCTIIGGRVSRPLQHRLEL